jgi:SAM-dependent methyltransferase
MREHFDVNRALWDGWTALHASSSFYDIPGFRAGACTLKPIELAEVGDVAGRRLLHLQCHFGLDTLSWARRGAHVTGLDFSERAITLARSLAHDAQLDARFFCANVYDPPDAVGDGYDIVYTSYGVLAWLPELRPWGEVIARLLRPGGTFHLVELHPLLGMLSDDGRTLRLPYFHTAEPERYQVQGSYAAPDASFTHEAREWSHSLSDVVEAVLAAGLTLRSFREYPYSPHGCYPFLEESESGRWTVRGAPVPLPLTFSIAAVRADGG